MKPLVNTLAVESVHTRQRLDQFANFVVAQAHPTRYKFLCTTTICRVLWTHRSCPFHDRKQLKQGIWHTLCRRGCYRRSGTRPGFCTHCCGCCCGCCRRNRRSLHGSGCIHGGSYLRRGGLECHCLPTWALEHGCGRNENGRARWTHDMHLPWAQRGTSIMCAQLRVGMWVASGMRRPSRAATVVVMD